MNLKQCRIHLKDCLRKPSTCFIDFNHFGKSSFINSSMIFYAYKGLIINISQAFFCLCGDKKINQLPWFLWWWARRFQQKWRSPEVCQSKLPLWFRLLPCKLCKHRQLPKLMATTSALWRLSAQFPVHKQRQQDKSSKTISLKIMRKKLKHFSKKMEKNLNFFSVYCIEDK